MASPKPHLSLVGELIRQWLKERGENQEALAIGLGVTSTYVSLVVHGKSTLTAKKAIQFSDYFRKDPRELMHAAIEDQLTKLGR